MKEFTKRFAIFTFGYGFIIALVFGIMRGLEYLCEHFGDYALLGFMLVAISLGFTIASYD